MTVRGSITCDQIAGASKQGAGATLQTYAGASAPVAGNVAVFDAAGGGLIDSGSRPGSGGGGGYSLLSVNGVAVIGTYISVNGVAI